VKAPGWRLAHRHAEEEARCEAASRPAGGTEARLINTWRSGGVEAGAAASRGRHEEEKSSFALSWTPVARDKEALGGARGQNVQTGGRRSGKQWVPL
jgi:hypothetical protein